MYGVSNHQATMQHLALNCKLLPIKAPWVNVEKSVSPGGVACHWMEQQGGKLNSHACIHKDFRIVQDGPPDEI